MVNITEEIITKLKEVKFTVPPEDIRRIYSTKTPVYPLVVVSEVLNTPTLQLHGEEKFSRIGYKFEVYSRDKSVNGELYTKEQINDMLLRELDEAIRTTFGLKRVVTSPPILYSSDKSIYRQDVIYEGKIDNKTMIIYQ